MLLQRTPSRRVGQPASFACKRRGRMPQLAPSSVSIKNGAWVHDPEALGHIQQALRCVFKKAVLVRCARYGCVSPELYL